MNRQGKKILLGIAAFCLLTSYFAPCAFAEELNPYKFYQEHSSLGNGKKDYVQGLDEMYQFLRSCLEKEMHCSPGDEIIPVETVNNCVYNVERKTTYGDNDLYGHAFFHVTGGETYLVSGGSSSNILEFPLGAFYSKSGEKLMSFGEKPSGIYENEPVLAPFDAVTLVVNQNNGASLAVYQAIYDENQNSHKYDLTLADEMIRLQKLNPFCFKPFPEGYVTFVFDDLTDDIDSVAATFEEYGYPLVLAAIPDRLEAGATALTDRRGSYSPGMIMKDIMETVVRLGGEIMVHNRAPVVTEKNQRDYDFMYDYFIQAKDLLTEAGFSPRGIIRAGGDGALQRSEEIERWLIGNYDYSNMGLAGNYCLDRKSINRPINEVKNDIKYANDNKAWIRFMCHGYAFGEGKTFRNESDLREILDYCRSIGVEVVTYAYMIDQYKSTELSEWQ